MTKGVSLFQYISSLRSGCRVLFPPAIKFLAGRQEGGRVVHWHMVGFIICRKSEKVEKGNQACWHGVGFTLR